MIPAPDHFRAALVELAMLDKTNLELALRRIAQVSARTVDVERVSYWELSSDHSLIRCRVLYTRKDDGFTSGAELRALDFPRYFEALLACRAIVADDARTHVQTNEFVESYFTPAGITSMLDVPVWRAGRLVGVLCHEHVGPPRTWSVAEQDFAHGLANMLSVALEAVERHRAEERYTMLARATNDVVWDWNLDTGRVEFSDALTSTFGRDPREIETVDRWLDCVHADDRMRVKQSVRDALATDSGSWTGQYRFLRGDGTVAVVIDRGYVARDCDGRAARMVGSMLDVTERVAMEARLALSDRMASIGALAAGVAHEINNPLTYIMWNVSSTIDGLRAGTVNPDEAIELLRDAQEGAERVRRVVRDLQTFSRPREDDLELVDLRDVIDSSISMARNEIRHRAQLVKDYRAAPRVRVNRARLGQVVLNLLINAAQAIPAGNFDHHTIRIRTSVTNAGQAVIEIADTGCGIAPDAISRVFEPFFTTKPVGVGTGLGLAICHSIVTASGGSIDVDSPPAGGCIVRVSLPAAPCEVAVTVPAPAPSAPRRRVMIVDDEPLVRKVFRRMLEPQHDLIVVESGELALEQMRSGPPIEVILCDLMMPQMTGMELYHRLQLEHPGMAERMVFLTGGAFSQAATEFVTTSNRPVLEKPISLVELSRAIAAVG